VNPVGFDLGTLVLFLRLVPFVPQPDWEALQQAAEAQVTFAERVDVETSLRCGERVEELSASSGVALVIPVMVQEDTFQVTITSLGGTGDADLYLMRDTPPQSHQYDRRPFQEGNLEQLQVRKPVPGRWYLAVHAFDAFDDVTIRMECLQYPEMEKEVSYEDLQELELAMYYELSGDTVQTNRVVRGTLQFERLRQEGREAFEAGNFDQALEIWKSWSVQEPDNPRPVALVGDIYLRLGQIDEAIEWYNKSLNVQPGQVGLMTRLSRLLDVEGGKPVEARELLNHYNRLFPSNPSVALAQAEWLLRRKRFEEAENLIRRVLSLEPDNLNAHTLLHALLQDPKDRFENMQDILRIGEQPGRELPLALTATDSLLLTHPESWVLMDFFQKQSLTSRSEQVRKRFQDLLPREEITREDFRIGRMSANWISSRDQLWGEDGNLILSADPSQTEAYLRLIRSDAMQNGFVESEIEDTQGFFWIYARRGGGNMIRFGFEENGQVYLQVWMDNQLLSMQSRVWSREPGPAVLRLELRGDGAYGFVNGRPAFNTPVQIPADMGLGWWGIAPWSPVYGRAKVSVRKVSGGPLPVRVGYVPDPLIRFRRRTSPDPAERYSHLQPLKSRLNELSSLAPEWMVQDVEGTVRLLPGPGDLEIRLLARYYRLRLLPAVNIQSPYLLDVDQLVSLAREQQVDGFTLVMHRLPRQDWLKEFETRISMSPITVHILMPDFRSGKTRLIEYCSRVGMFAGPRHPRTLPGVEIGGWLPDRVTELPDGDAVLMFSGGEP